jgi:hypothetical protein
MTMDTPSAIVYLQLEFECVFSSGSGVPLVFVDSVRAPMPVRISKGKNLAVPSSLRRGLGGNWRLELLSVCITASRVSVY